MHVPPPKHGLGVLQDAAFSAEASEDIWFLGLAALGHMMEKSEKGRPLGPYCKTFFKFSKFPIEQEPCFKPVSSFPRIFS